MKITRRITERLVYLLLTEAIEKYLYPNRYNMFP